jgi:hypothetical protein
MYLWTGLGKPVQHSLKTLYTCSVIQPAKCAQWVIAAPFRKDFANFREELRKEMGKRVTFRRDRGAFVDRWLKNSETRLKEIHEYYTKNLAKDSDPIQILVEIRYALESKKKELDFIIP